MKQKDISSLNYYVNNKDFYKSILEWRKKEEETGIKKIPDKIALSIMKICENLAKSGRFSGYTWKSEMIADAILSCIQYCRNFDPTKSQNPFAFYTQIAYNAFVQRIKLEKQKIATQFEYTKQIEMLYDIASEYDDEDNRFENVNNKIRNYTDNVTKDKDDAQKSSIKVKKPFSRAQQVMLMNKKKIKTVDDF